ncbi:hypothetical protein TNCV_1439901 [Trichonephila clavipes]|nr:hypothetical protein TNCV_1439901 [Trichonephila clavipes]
MRREKPERKTDHQDRLHHTIVTLYGMHIVCMRARSLHRIRNPISTKTKPVHRYSKQAYTHVVQISRLLHLPDCLVCQASIRRGRWTEDDSHALRRHMPISNPVGSIIDGLVLTNYRLQQLSCRKRSYFQ